MKRLSTFILSLLTFFLLAGCSTEDDVLEIFLGKTWKLTYISTENNPRVPFDFWGDGTPGKHYAETLEGDVCIITFEGSEINDITGGTFNAIAISATINGQWNANGESHEMTTSNVRISHTENNPVAIAFVRALQNAIRYEGDSQNLFIYYKDNDNSIKRINLIAR